MSFWNNPENNSLKMLLIGVVVIGAGAFAYHAMNNGGNTGRVISTASAPSMQTAAAIPARTGLVFNETTTGKTCTMTVTDPSNAGQSVTIAGTVAPSGDCRANAAQANPNATAMANAMGAGMTVASLPPATPGSGLIFNEVTTGTTCTMTVTNAANSKQSVTVAGTVAPSGDCKANPTQANPAAETMASAMNGSMTTVRID